MPTRNDWFHYPSNQINAPDQGRHRVDEEYALEVAALQHHHLIIHAYRTIDRFTIDRRTEISVEARAPIFLEHRRGKFRIDRDIHACQFIEASALAAMSEP